VQLSRWVDIDGATVLDVGGGPGYFADAFRGAGAIYVGLEPDAGEMAARGKPEPGTLRASGEELPIRTGSVDVCYSSNVLEHVRNPWTMADEMVRVTKPGGTVYLSFPPWLGPFGGHETAPWHYLGGYRARRRFVRRTGAEPKNKFGESVFVTTAGAALRWARACPDAELVSVEPRYHPWWAAWITRVPGLREFASVNVVLVLRRKA
jgi:SAM-dependent methyltransferase